LHQTEFAEALALKPDSLFVSQMFSMIDRDSNGFISFRELLYAVLLFAQGMHYTFAIFVFVLTGAECACVRLSNQACLSLRGRLV
jgi:hypothetical protein